MAWGDKDRSDVLQENTRHKPQACFCICFFVCVFVCVLVCLAGLTASVSLLYNIQERSNGVVRKGLLHENTPQIKLVCVFAYVLVCVFVSYNKLA